MANGWFAKGLEAFAGGDAAWDTDNIKIVGVDHATDTPVLATDQFLSDIASGARVFTSGNLAGKTFTDGVLDANDIVVTGVTGATVESLVFYQDTGSAASSRLLFMVDTATGLPFTPSGGDVTIQFDNGAGKIASL